MQSCDDFKMFTIRGALHFKSSACSNFLNNVHENPQKGDNKNLSYNIQSYNCTLLTDTAVNKKTV